MTPIVSYLIPSRQRPEKLRRCIESIHGCHDKGSFQIIVGIDFDDDSYGNALQIYPTAHASIYGEMAVMGRMVGWEMLHVSFEKMMTHAAAPWIAFANDDMVLSGPNWDRRIREVPTKGFFCYPETHRLNTSDYPGEGGPMIIVPRDAWKLCGCRSVPQGLDSSLPIMLRTIGWQPRLIDGTVLWHDRDDPEQLREHRKKYIETDDSAPMEN